MVRKAGAGKRETAVQQNGSLEGRINGARDGGGAAQAVSGGGAEAGIAPEANIGFRIPRPLLYVGLGALGLGAAIYIAVRLVTAVPEPRPEPQPTAVVTPAISQYQKLALEEIALMSQYEPTIAALIPQTDWFNYRGVDGGEAQFIKKMREYTERGDYVTGTITHKDGSITNLFVLGTDKDKLEQSLAKTRQYLPLIANLLRIEYKKPLLIVDIFQGGGGAGFPKVDITNPNDLEHELGHTVYETSESEDLGLGQIPPWLGEGVPEIVNSYLRGGATLVEIKRNNISKTLEDRGIGPLFKMTLEPSIRPGGGPPQEVYDGGFLLLAEYAALAGYDNLWFALHDIYEERLTKSSLPQRVITNKDLENLTEEVESIIQQQHETIRMIFRQHVPSEKQIEFDQLYQISVYGQQK